MAFVTIEVTWRHLDVANLIIVKGQMLSCSTPLHITHAWYIGGTFQDVLLTCMVKMTGASSARDGGKLPWIPSNINSYAL